jgi:IstB-like ATP binding protein
MLRWARTDARNLAGCRQASDRGWVEAEVGQDRSIAFAHGAVTILLVASEELINSFAHQLTQPHRHLLRLRVEDAPADEWGRVFLGEQMTAAVLDRLCRRCLSFGMNGESYRFRESMKTRQDRQGD